jgi:hypothetical protein
MPSEIPLRVAIEALKYLFSSLFELEILKFLLQLDREVNAHDISIVSQDIRPRKLILFTEMKQF